MRLPCRRIGVQLSLPPRAIRPVHTPPHESRSVAGQRFVPALPSTPHSADSLRRAKVHLQRGQSQLQTGPRGQTASRAPHPAVAGTLALPLSGRAGLSSRDRRIEAKDSSRGQLIAALLLVVPLVHWRPQTQRLRFRLRCTPALAPRAKARQGPQSSRSVRPTPRSLVLA